MKNKNHYVAYVQNASGAGEIAGTGTNLSDLKAYVRRHYGRGWTVIIEQIEHDSGIMYFAPVEVARFTLRK